MVNTGRFKGVQGRKCNLGCKFREDFKREVLALLDLDNKREMLSSQRRNVRSGEVQTVW